jgi:flagellar motility protein MotE (MotC chaperone)
MRVFSNNGTGLLYAAGIGAMALLLLKFIGFIADRPTPQAMDGVANYGRVMARSGLLVNDPAVTGSVTGEPKKAAKEVPTGAEGTQKKDQKQKGGVLPTGNGESAERYGDGSLKNSKDLPTPTSDNTISKNAKAVPLSMPHHTLSPSEKALLERLGERRQQLEMRDNDLDTREKLLETTEKKIEQRINQLKELEERAASAATKKAENEGQTLKNVVVMYEAMKPKDAAKVFDRLSLDILVPVVLQMSPKKMSEVLAVMTPETAEKLTVALALRARSNEAKPPVMTGSMPLPTNELPAIEPNMSGSQRPATARPRS